MVSSDAAFRAAFDDQPELLQGMRRLAAYVPNETPVLISLANYVTSLKSNSTPSAGATEPNSKKRKIEGQAIPEISGSLVFSIPDISFSVPVRKKLKLEGVNGGVRGLDASGNVEVSVPWNTIDYVFCLPVPDKAKPQYNFVVIPKSESGKGTEAVVWTALDVNAKAPSPDQGPEPMARHLEGQLSKYHKKVIFPNDEDFVSQVGNTKGVKTYGARAHRGSKEGHLFFLGPGILWAFKKPLLFLPFHAITSISYTSVLQRTFNLVVTATEPGSDQETEIEFAMLDQADFAGIDAYIKRYGLNDASLAEGRKAKVYNVNAPKGAKGEAANAEANGEGLVDGETELQRAERELQDEEDEEEEDYVDEASDDDEGSSEDDEEGEEAFEEEQEFEDEAGGYEDEG